MTAIKRRWPILRDELLVALLKAYKEQRDPIPDSDLDNEQPISLNVRLTLGQGRELNIFEGVAFDQSFPTDQPYGKAIKSVTLGDHPKVELYGGPRPTNNANVGDPSERDVQAMLQAGRPAPNFRELKDGRVPNSKGPLNATEMNKLTRETPRLRCPECGEWNLATHFLSEAAGRPWPPESYNSDNITQQPAQLREPTLCEYCTDRGFFYCLGKPWRAECPHNPASNRK